MLKKLDSYAFTHSFCPCFSSQMFWPKKIAVFKHECVCVYFVVGKIKCDLTSVFSLRRFELYILDVNLKLVCRPNRKQMKKKNEKKKFSWTMIESSRVEARRAEQIKKLNKNVSCSCVWSVCVLFIYATNVIHRIHFTP